MKALVAAWKDHAYLTLIGRNMLVNSMIYGRFRYYIQAMSPPKRLMEAVMEDAQAMLWGGDVEFDPDAKGTELARRRFIKEGAQFADRKTELGASVMHWQSHIAGLQVHWLLKYKDATQSPWKQVLDRWFDREGEGRGIIFTTVRPKDLWASDGPLETKLPTFWKDALLEFKTLKLHPRMPGEFRWTELDVNHFSPILASMLTANLRTFGVSDSTPSQSKT